MTIEFDGFKEQVTGVTFGVRCVTCEEQADPSLTTGEITKLSTILAPGRNGIMERARDDAKNHEREFGRRHRIIVTGILFRADEPYPGGYFIDKP